MILNTNNIKHKLENKFKSKPELIYILKDNITKNIEKELIEYFQKGSLIFHQEKLQDFFFYQYNCWKLKNNYENYNIIKVFDEVSVKDVSIVNNSVDVHIKINNSNLYRRKNIIFYEQFIEKEFIEDLIINENISAFEKKIKSKEEKLLKINNTFYINIFIYLSKILNQKDFNHCIPYLLKEFNNKKNKKEFLVNLKYCLVDKRSEYMINGKYIYLNYYNN